VLAVLTTHPIQYQVPIWKGLTAREVVPLKVFYMSDQGLEPRFDPGFGKNLAWDIDLLGGYESEFLGGYGHRRPDSFWKLRLKPGFGRALRRTGVEVLWLQGWQVAAYWQAVLEARSAGIEVWLRGETNSRSHKLGIAGRLKRRLVSELLHRVDRLLYIGKANRKFYLDQNIAEEKLASAPYCVDNARFSGAAAAARPVRQHLRDRWGIPSDAFCFLFAGKFVNSKRPFDLVGAAKRVQSALSEKKIHLLWVGAGQLGQAVRRACDIYFDAESNGWTYTTIDSTGPRASFVGFLNQSKISDAYAAADCLVLPSDQKETWGLVVNEAMASGLPCIVSNACGCAEDLVEPIRPDLTYPMGDVAALEHAMKSALTNPPSRELLQTHIAKYDVGRTIEIVEKLYFEAFSRSAAGATVTRDEGLYH
jgi:glycosyltransferase involved in cell wall biosynthesis